MQFTTEKGDELHLRLPYASLQYIHTGITYLVAFIFEATYLALYLVLNGQSIHCP